MPLQDATTSGDAPEETTSESEVAAETQEAPATESASKSASSDGQPNDSESGAPSCAGDPTVVLGDGGAMPGDLAQETFQRAICTCTSLTASGGLTTDGFNSTIGPPDGGLGGNVAVNQNVTWSAHASVGGNLVIPGNLQASATATVRGNLYLGGHGTASTSVTVDGNAYLVDPLPRSHRGRHDVDGGLGR